MNGYEVLAKDEKLNKIIDSINEANKDYLFACHGRYHTMFVVNTIEYILTNIGCDEKTVTLGKIAGLLHDIGTLYGKRDHAQRSSEMCEPFLRKINLPPKSKRKVIQAIEDHQKGLMIESEVGAALLIADKIDLSKDRVLELGKKDLWHKNLLNIKKTEVSIEKKNIIVNYVTNNKFNEELFLEGWKKGCDVPIQAAKFLGYECIFRINGNPIIKTFFDLI